jgi:hypothetical protein
MRTPTYDEIVQQLYALISEIDSPDANYAAISIKLRIYDRILKALDSKHKQEQQSQAAEDDLVNVL